MTSQLKTQASALAGKARELGERALEEIKKVEISQWLESMRETVEGLRKGLIARFAK